MNLQSEEALADRLQNWEEQRQRRADQSATIVRPSGFIGNLLDANMSFLYKIPSYVFGPFPLYTMGLVSRHNFFLVGLTLLLMKLGLLIALAVYLNMPSAAKRARMHPWAYTPKETAQLDSMLNDWQGYVFSFRTGRVMFSCQLALTLLLTLLTAYAVTGKVPRLRMLRMSKLAKFTNFVSLLVSLFHILQMLLPAPFIAQLAKLKLLELQSAGLVNTTQLNLKIFYYNKAKHSGSSHKPFYPSFMDKVHFNEKCCGVRSADDWMEFSAELAIYAEFLAERPGQLPPRFRSHPPLSCYDPSTHRPNKNSCAPSIASRYLANQDELLPLSMIAILSIVAAFYLQRAYTAQDGLAGLDPKAIRLAGDVASASSLTGGSAVTDRQIDTTVPLVSVPTRMVRPIFEQCPKVGECTADVAHARLGYNEPLSFEERTTVACSPQFFPLCFSPEAGAIISLLQFCIRVIWGIVIFYVFVTNFARFYYKTSLGSSTYSRLLIVATLVAFVFPVVVSKRFLLVTLLFIPSLFLEFGGGYVTSKIVEAVFSGPFQTLMHNLNQTQLSMQCFMLSGSDLVEAGLKLSLKPFVNIAHEYMTTTLLLSFLFKRLNSSSTALHFQYTSGTQTMFDDLMIKNEEMEKNVYDKVGKPSDPDQMEPQLQQASQQADAVLEESEKAEEQEEAQAIMDMNRRINRGKAMVKLAREQYNKFTVALAKARKGASAKFRKTIKKMCKTILFDMVNKCHKVGNRLCKRFNDEVPWYMKLTNLILGIFDCSKVRDAWDKNACERVKPNDFVKKQCLKYARESSPLPGTDSEFMTAFQLIEKLIHFVTVDFEFTTVVGRFVPNISIDDIIVTMAAAAFLLIEMSRIGIFNQTWELINDMMIGAIIGEIFIFIKRFNSDLSFCNHYVTQQLIDIDYRRKQTIVDPVTQRARDSLLPFAGWEMREPVWIGDEHEEELLSYPEQVSLTAGEVSTIKRKYVADLGMLAIIGVIFLANYLVCEAVDMMNAGLPANLTFEGTSQLNVTVQGVDSNLAKRLTFGLVRDLTHTAVVNTTVELEDCKVTTKRIDDDDVNAVVTLLVLKLCMNLLYGYMSRLRPFLCALFYPEQQRRRTVALYNQLLRRRGKRQKEFRVQVLQRILAEKFNIDPFGIVTKLRLRSPTWNSIFGSLPFMNGNVQCLCCGDRGFEQFKICLECNGAYCRPCWYQLNSMCLLCILLYKRLAVDYEETREELRQAMQMESAGEAAGSPEQ
ncbi:hypothetical protein BOX15_Mlig000509g1 [Macrostomum lignano]|nr:hypothetical protein BOX15_Mlig000509g1 [Macrostomum lignano]